MATNLNAERMSDRVQAIGRIIWEPWVDVPESVMRRFPEMRSWNKSMRLRDESNRSRLDEEIARLQTALL